MTKVTDKLLSLLVHFVFGGFLSLIGGFLGFYIGMSISRYFWRYAENSITEFDYITISGIAIGALLFIYIYIKRFILNKKPIWDI